MPDLDRMDRLFIGWAFAFQVILIVHFAIRRRFFESYTVRFGWLVYALCIPAAVISLVLLLSGKSWSYWLGGFLFVLFAAFGYWVDYVMGFVHYHYVCPGLIIFRVELVERLDRRGENPYLILLTRESILLQFLLRLIHDRGQMAEIEDIRLRIHGCHR